jgi:hypothetical protein
MSTTCTKVARCLQIIVKYDPRKIFVQENDNLLRLFPGKMCHGNLALLKENFLAIYGEKIFVDVSFILDKK